MFGRNEVVSRLVRCGLFGIAVAAAVPIAMEPPEARADGYVRGLKAHTAAVLGAVETAVSKLDDAKEALKNAKDLLRQANGRLLAAGAAATEGLRQAAIRAAALVAAAEGAVVVAAKAVAVATAAAAAFTAGTLAGQGLGWVVSWCWDPYCPADCDCDEFPFATDAEVERWLPNCIFNATGVEADPRDFDEADEVFPGAGEAAWNYLRQMTRTLAIGSRGLAAHTARDWASVRMARSQLESALRQSSDLIPTYTAYLSQIETWAGSARADIASAVAELELLEELVPQFPDPAEMQAAIDDARAGLAMATAALDTISDGAGNPRPLDGPQGFLEPLTLSRYHDFLADCAVRGVAALPEAEWRMIDGLWADMGLNLRGQPSVGPSIAAWDGRGDTGDEAADFGPDGLLPASELLHAAIPAFYSWANMLLPPSPLVADAAEPWSTHVEPPVYIGGPNGQQDLIGQDGWYVPAVPGSQPHRVYTYQGNTLGVPMDPMGGFGQFIGGRGIGGNQVLRSQKDIQFAHYTTFWADVFVGPPDNVPAPPVIARLSLEPFDTSASFAVQFNWNNPNAPTGFNVSMVVFDENGTMTPPNGIVPGPRFGNLQFGRWYRFSAGIDFVTNRVDEISWTDLDTLEYTIFRPTIGQWWYLRGGADGGPFLPDAIRLTGGSPTAPGNTSAWDNLAVARDYGQDTPPSVHGVRMRVFDHDTDERRPAAVLTADVGSSRPAGFQWLRDGEEVTDDDRIRGATTPNLHIEPAFPSDSGLYTFIVTNPWGEATSEPQDLVIPCRADYNGDGQVDFFDYLDFVLDYDLEDPRADFNGDGQIDFFDYLDFVLAYDAACE